MLKKASKAKKSAIGIREGASIHSKTTMTAPSTMNRGDIAAGIFEPFVERIPYGAGMVSWTAVPGVLFVHRVKVKMAS